MIMAVGRPGNVRSLVEYIFSVCLLVNRKGCIVSLALKVLIVKPLLKTFTFGLPMGRIFVPLFLDLSW